MARLIVSSSREQIIFNEGVLPSSSVLATHLPYQMRRNLDHYAIPNDEGTRQAAMLTLLGACTLRRYLWRVEDRPLETWLFKPNTQPSVFGKWFKGRGSEYRLLVHRMPRPPPSDPRFSRPEDIWDKLHQRIKLERRPIPKASMTAPVYRLLEELHDAYSAEPPRCDTASILEARKHPYSYFGISLKDLAARSAQDPHAGGANTKSTDH